MKRIFWSLLGVICLCAFASCAQTNTKAHKAEVPFAGVPAPKDVVMYEVNERLFAQEGECLKAVTFELDRIKSLGVNVLWLMPITEFGIKNGANSPYSTKNYTALAPEYGTMEDLHELVATAHSKGMAVIIDWVANHTSWDNPWLEHKDWYTQDSLGNVISPRGFNWRDVADLNFDNKDMRLAMIEAMKYWIKEANIDGYRCDAADLVPDDFWAEAVSALRSAFPERTLLMLAEGEKKEHFTSGFEMNYAWHFWSALVAAYREKSAKIVYQAHVKELAEIPQDAVKLRFTTNHDKSAYEGTPIKNFNGEEGSLGAATVTFLLGGAPLLYSSQELGLERRVVFMLPAGRYNPLRWNENAEYGLRLAKIMEIHNGSAVYSEGTTEDYSTDDVVAFTRSIEGKSALVLVNIRDHSVSVPIPESYIGKGMTNKLTDNDSVLSEKMDLAPYQYLIFETK